MSRFSCCFFVRVFVPPSLRQVQDTQKAVHVWSVIYIVYKSTTKDYTVVAVGSLDRHKHTLASGRKGGGGDGGTQSSRVAKRIEVAPGELIYLCANNFQWAPPNAKCVFSAAETVWQFGLQK